MQMAGARQFRDKAAGYLNGDEPVLITKHGKISGLYLPLESSSTIPENLRKDLARVLGRHLQDLMDLQKIKEEDIQEDFREHRRHRS